MPPVGAAIAAAAGAVKATIGAIAATAVGSALVQAGASIALSFAAQRLLGGGSPPAPQPQRRTVTIRQSDAVGDIVYGEVRKGGLMAYVRSSGSKSRFLHIVVVLAPHEVEEIGAVYFDGRMVRDAQGGVVRLSNRYLFIEKRLGGPDQTAFPRMVASSGGQWTNEHHRLPGMAALYLRLRSDTKRYPRGIPEITVDIKGKNDIYDPRTGQRGYTTNAALCLADYMHSEFGLGMAYSADQIDPDALIEAANICDETVPRPEGGAEPRYTCNGTASTALTPKAIIEGMGGAMAGGAYFVGGRAIIRAGAHRAPVYALNPSNLRGSVEFTPKQSRRDSFNTAKGTFVSPQADWQPDSWPEVVEPVFLAQDKGIRSALDLPLAFTTSASTGQRIGRIELRRARAEVVKFPAHLAAIDVVPGDNVTLEMPLWGMTAPQQFTVLAREMNIDESGVFPTFTLQATSAALYEAGDDVPYSEPLDITVVDPLDVPSPGIPQVTEALYATADGAGIKVRAFLTWEEPDFPYVQSYQVAMAVADGPMVPQGSVIASEDVQPSFQIDDVPLGQVRFEIVATSTTGAVSDPAVLEYAVIGDQTTPEPLANFRVASAGSIAVLSWAQSVDLDVRAGGQILIRHAQPGGAWSGSQFVAALPGGETQFTTPMWPGIYLIRAQDVGGRLGPVAQAFTGGATALAFAPITTLQADPLFTGAKTNLFLAADDTLRLVSALAWDDLDQFGDFDDVPGTVDSVGGVVTDGLYEFAAGADLGSVRAVRVQSVLEFISVPLDDLFDDRPSSVDEWEDWDGTDGTEVDVRIEARTTLDDPSGTPAWTDWSEITAGEIEARALQARIQVSTEDNGISAHISRARVKIDEVA